MAVCPFAVYRPISVNHGGAMTGHLGFVPHDQEGNGSLYEYFSNPAVQVSSTFWCSKTGLLEQYLDTDVIAWAEKNGNGTYNSCEFEGFASEPWTDAQLARGAQVIVWLNSIYHWPITGPVPHGTPGVTPHCNPNGTPDPNWGNHPCPGPIRLAQIPAMVALATTPTTHHTEGNMITRDNVSGGTWVARPNATIYAFTGAPYLGPLPKYTAQWGIGTASNPVVGIVSDNAGGFILATDNGGPQPAVYHIDASGQYAK